MQRTTAAKAWLTIAQKRMAALHNKMADLRIRYDEAVTVATESREKLAALVKRTHRD
jgi:hypothetical protein